MSRLLLVNGTACSVSVLARLHGLNPQTVHSRLRRGWSLELAVSAPTHEPQTSGALGASRSPWSVYASIRQRT